MLLFIIKRVLLLIPILLGVTLVAFVVTRLLPGDPALVILGIDAPESAILALREELGLDRPAHVRYFDWIGHLLQAEFGTSYTYKVSVVELLKARVEITVPLALMAMVMSVVIALVLGIYAAANHIKSGDVAVMGVSQLGISIPNFWLAVLLILVFAVNLRWFSSGGFPGWDVGFWPSFAALILPAIALATVQGAILARFTRSAVLDTMRED